MQLQIWSFLNFHTSKYKVYVCSCVALSYLDLLFLSINIYYLDIALKYVSSMIVTIIQILANISMAETKDFVYLWL